MNTLYDVLGIDRQANAAQIEQGYRSMIELLAKNGDDKNYERDMIRAKAIKEAYAILSSPQRRPAYDEKLRARQQVSYEIVEKPGMPWISLALIALVLAGSFGYYKYSSHQAEMELATLNAAKAKHEAETAAKLADVEAARLEQQLLLAKNNVEMARQRESDTARRDGEMIHNELQRAEAQSARDKEQAARQAKSERLQEERAAVYRSREQAAAMQRALAIPIGRR